VGGITCDSDERGADVPESKTGLERAVGELCAYNGRLSAAGREKLAGIEGPRARVKEDGRGEPWVFINQKVPVELRKFAVVLIVG